MSEIVPTQLPIRSEADAWRLLEQAIRDELPEGALEVSFDGWPVFTIRLQGRHFDASLTASVMEGLVELQKSINRAYALLRYDRGTSTVLSDEEKALLEFVVRVDAGSSLAKIDLTEVFKTFVEKAVERMEPRHKVATVLGVAAMVATTVCWKDYLATQLEGKKVAAEAEIRLALSQEETRRMEIMERAIEMQPLLQLQKAEADEGRNSVLRGLRQADTAILDGIELDGDTVRLAVRQKRSAAEEVRMDGNYRICKLDNSPVDHYRVVVLSSDGKEFQARLDNRFASSVTEWNKLNEALKGRQSVYLKVNARVVRGEVRDATIIEVSDPVPPVPSVAGR